MYVTLLIDPTPQSPTSHYYFILYRICLCVSVWAQQTNREENDGEISLWLDGLGAQPWRQRLMMYFPVLTFSVCHPAVYLPHLDQRSVCLCGRVEERLCLFQCLVVYVSHMGPGGYNIVQQMPRIPNQVKRHNGTKIIIFVGVRQENQRKRAGWHSLEEKNNSRGKWEIRI